MLLKQTLESLVVACLRMLGHPIHHACFGLFSWFWPPASSQHLTRSFDQYQFCKPSTATIAISMGRESVESWLPKQTSRLEGASSLLVSARSSCD